jgi:hypothetical protein
MQSYADTNQPYVSQFILRGFHTQEGRPRSSSTSMQTDTRIVRRYRDYDFTDVDLAKSGFGGEHTNSNQRLMYT